MRGLWSNLCLLCLDLFFTKKRVFKVLLYDYKGQSVRDLRKDSRSIYFNGWPTKQTRSLIVQSFLRPKWGVGGDECKQKVVKIITGVVGSWFNRRRKRAEGSELRSRKRCVWSVKSVIETGLVWVWEGSEGHSSDENSRRRNVTQSTFNLTCNTVIIENNSWRQGWHLRKTLLRREIPTGTSYIIVKQNVHFFSSLNGY